MTRKGLFDAILHGCIPVTFDPLTARSMYTWHWEEEYWKEVSIEYPWDGVAKRYFDVVLALKELMAKNQSLIARKQGRYIHEYTLLHILLHTLSYLFARLLTHPFLPSYTSIPSPDP